MILDADGRRLRRAIGFRLEYIAADDPAKTSEIELIGSDRIETEEHDALESCKIL